MLLAEVGKEEQEAKPELLAEAGKEKQELGVVRQEEAGKQELMAEVGLT